MLIGIGKVELLWMYLVTVAAHCFTYEIVVI